MKGSEEKRENLEKYWITNWEDVHAFYKLSNAAQWYSLHRVWKRNNALPMYSTSGKRLKVNKLLIFIINLWKETISPNLFYALVLSPTLCVFKFLIFVSLFKKFHVYCRKHDDC